MWPSFPFELIVFAMKMNSEYKWWSIVERNLVKNLLPSDAEKIQFIIPYSFLSDQS